MTYFHEKFGLLFEHTSAIEKKIKNKNDSN